MFDQETGRRLVERARRTVEVAVRNRTTTDGRTSADGSTTERGDGATIDGGAFVTLERDDALRGCCGRLEHDGPLPEAVEIAARQAALSDPRFQPVEPPELEAIAVSVTALSPPESVPGEDPAAVREAVEVGRHGLVVSRGRTSGVLLPQVPVEQGWDTTAFLRGVCRKAGLPTDAWRRDDVTLERFSGRVFAEREPTGDVVERTLSSERDERSPSQERPPSASGGDRRD